MPTNAELLAKLSPEQRGALFQQLSGRNAGATRAVTRKRRQVRVGDGTNFRMRLCSVGILDSLEAVALERRTPGPGEVEVEVHATSLNFRDLMLALGIYPSKDTGNFNMGLDWSGRVTAVGAEVTRLAVGDEVIGLTPTDFSAYVTCPHDYVVRKPKTLSFVDAATIPTVFLTAYFALHHLGRLQHGERALIHSAAGGVGLAAIEVARWLKADIYATAGNEEKRQYVQQLGAAHVFDSHSIAWVDQLMQATANEGVDVVLNSLTGESLVKGFTVLRDCGRFVEIGLRDLMSDATIPLRPFSRSLSFMATGIVPSHRQVRRAQMLEHIVSLFDQGEFRTIANSVYGLDKIVDAFSFMSQGTHKGKITLDMRGQSVEVMD
jgi:NADPH:quinone reductase-like Zn-dependent oxidoreductase